MTIDTLHQTPGPLTKPIGVVGTVAFLAGGALLIWLSSIHFHLWQSVGYRRIPTIGPLFLIQSIAGLIFGLLAMAVRQLWTAILGAGFAVATMAGFLLSVGIGLFGFKDSWSAPDADLAFGLEIATVAVFGTAAALCLLGTYRKNQEPELIGSAPSAPSAPSAHSA